MSYETANGVMVAAGISRFRLYTRDVFFNDPIQAPTRFTWTSSKIDLETGYHRNPTEELKFFTDAGIFTVQKNFVLKLVAAGFQHQATLAVQGPIMAF